MLFALLALSSMVNAVYAQIYPKPSVPEFTIKLVAHPYDVPDKTTTTIDEYTGKETTTTQPGYHVENKSIEIIIRNQYCSPSYYLFYNVRQRGHYGEYWTELYSYDSSAFNSGNLLLQSSSEYTVLSLPAVYPFIDGAEVDFQVEALLWHNIEVWIADHPLISGGGMENIGHYEDRLALYSDSGWSGTKTLAFEASQTPSPEPTPTPTDPNFGPTSPPSQEPLLTQEQLALILGLGTIVAAFTVLLLYFIHVRRGIQS
jgi:hypothetical protein